LFQIVENEINGDSVFEVGSKQRTCCLIKFSTKVCLVLALRLAFFFNIALIECRCEFSTNSSINLKLLYLEYCLFHCASCP